MLALSRFALLLQFFSVAILCESAAYAEPGGIGGIPKTPTRTPLALDRTITTATPNVRVYVGSRSDEHCSSVRCQTPCGGCIASMAWSEACPACVSHVSIDTFGSIDLSGYSVLVQDAESATPSLTHLRGSVRAGSSVRYVFAGRHTVGLLQNVDGNAALSVEDCTGRSIAVAHSAGPVSTVDAVTSNESCRVLRIEARTDTTFELSAYNYR